MEILINRLYLCPGMNTQRELERQIEIEKTYIFFVNLNLSLKS